MVGGNGYYGGPDQELFIRWIQANTFMPSIQFSFVPWDFTNDTVESISMKFVELHDKYTNVIIAAMNESISKGYPVNAPIWWIDPANPDALANDDGKFTKKQFRRFLCFFVTFRVLARRGHFSGTSAHKRSHYEGHRSSGRYLDRR